MARNAFRVGLQQDTPLPTALATQELDPGDILEVRDMAEAIARAEQIVAAPRSSRPSRGGADLFEALGRPTDDIAGPAVHAPPRQTPLPPPPVARFLSVPSPSVVVEDDAYYQPAGRMRSLADVTLDGYRPEPTLLLRAAGRRRRFSVLLVAILLPLVALAAVAVFAIAEATSASDMPRLQTPATRSANEKTPLATTGGSTKHTPAATTRNAPKTAPVFDVNSLPSAGPIRTKR